MRLHVSFFVVLAFVSAIFCSCSKEDAENNKYCIYWAPLCNWSNRPVIARDLLGLQDVIKDYIVSHTGDSNIYGWGFPEELDFKDGLYMKFRPQGESGYLLDELDQEVPELNNADQYIVLLKVDPLNVLASDFPIFNNPDDEIYFMIKSKDLEECNFKKVKLVFRGS